MQFLTNISYEPFLIIVFTVFISLFYKKICNFFNLYDEPKNIRKLHKIPIPLINGFLLLISTNIYLIFDIYFLKENYLRFNLLLIILINFFYLLGYFDDLRDLSPKLKSSIIIAILLIIIPFDQNLILKSLIFESLIEKEILLNQSSLFLTVFFIYIFFNFLNFIDGLNGIAISISSYFILILGFERGYFYNIEVLIVLCLILCLFFNLRDKSFLGNSGISLLGILISTLYIKEYNINQTILCDEIFIIFFIPGIDMTRLVFSRIYSGNSISNADLNHLHHHLLKICDKKYVFLVYLTISIFPYILSKFIVNYFLVIIVCLLIYFLLIYFLKRFNKNI